MKAIVYTEYGPPEVLRLEQVAKPAPKDDQVLIRVHAASVTTGDVNIRGFVFVPPGFGPLPRLMFGLTRPKLAILGTEVAGQVEAIGKQVKSFREGDQVFGINSSVLGAYAEYVCRPEKGALAIKPANLSYEQAAAIPFGASTALYFLRDLAKLKQGQSILIVGASGGVGTFAVQLAKYYGALVTGVCSTTNLQLVKSLGADRVIDYTKHDFTGNGETYDVIYDCVNKTVFSGCKNSLKPNGLYLAGAGGPQAFVQMAWTSIVGGKKVLAGTNAETKQDLIFLRELIEAGNIRPVIDRCYPLEQMVDAHRYVDKGHKRGSVIITVEQTKN